MRTLRRWTRLVRIRNEYIRRGSGVVAKVGKMRVTSKLLQYGHVKGNQNYELVMKVMEIEG